MDIVNHLTIRQVSEAAARYAAAIGSTTAEVLTAVLVRQDPSSRRAFAKQVANELVPVAIPRRQAELLAQITHALGHRDPAEALVALIDRAAAISLAAD